jgi:6-methylsalicylate decarboxylase
MKAALIDVHHHALPPAYLTALAEVGVNHPVRGAAFPIWTPAGSLSAMDEAGIQTAVLSITSPGLGFVSGDRAQKIARDVNEYLAGLVQQDPRRFGAFALLPVDDVDIALEEARYGLDVLNLDGIGLFTSAHGRYLGDPHYEPLIAELDVRQVPVFVHPSVAGGPGPDLGIPESVIEFPIETTRAAANLLFSGTLDRYPALKIILSHAGGALPFLARRMTYASTINPDLEGGAPVDLLGSLGRLYYDVAMSATPEQMSCLRSLVGPDHILFGSDYPFMPADHAVSNSAGFRAFRDSTGQGLEADARAAALRLIPRLA